MIVNSFPLEETSPLDGHYGLVSSYYGPGPGAFAFWVLSIISVVAVWKCNPKHALSRDTISLGLCRPPSLSDLCWRGCIAAFVSV
jgi:hypothetical protein